MNYHHLLVPDEIFALLTVFFFYPFQGFLHCPVKNSVPIQNVKTICQCFFLFSFFLRESGLPHDFRKMAFGKSGQFVVVLAWLFFLFLGSMVQLLAPLCLSAPRLQIFRPCYFTEVFFGVDLVRRFCEFELIIEHTSITSLAITFCGSMVRLMPFSLATFGSM